MTVEFTGKSLRNAIILCVVIFSLFMAYYFMTKPSTYEDCILTYLKTGASNYTANFIDDICEAKFKK